MNCKIMITFIFFSLLLSACVAPQYNYQPKSTQISEPPIESVNVAYIGDILLRQGIYTEHDAIYVKNNTDISWAYTIMPGFYSKLGENEYSEFYVPSRGENGGIIDKAALADPWKCVKAYKNEKKLCIVTAFNAFSCNSDAVFERKKIAIAQSDSFQQTLIYNGNFENKLNIGYREFSNNLARPAYNNNVEYDLNQSNIIGYKGASIQIIEATNEFIKYRVIKNFNQAQL